jgi:hypothetical protein
MIDDSVNEIGGGLNEPGSTPLDPTMLTHIPQADREVDLENIIWSVPEIF